LLGMRKPSYRGAATVVMTGLVPSIHVLHLGENSLMLDMKLGMTGKC
jgi:hypothetical protein